MVCHPCIQRWDHLFQNSFPAIHVWICRPSSGPGHHYMVLCLCNQQVCLSWWGNEKTTICNVTFHLSETAVLMLHSVVRISPSSKQVSDITFSRLTPQTCTQPPPTCGLVLDQQVCGRGCFLTEDSSRLQENTHICNPLAQRYFFGSFYKRVSLRFYMHVL